MNSTAAVATSSGSVSEMARLAGGVGGHRLRSVSSARAASTP
jgi:hypothetical protein